MRGGFFFIYLSNATSCKPSDAHRSIDVTKACKTASRGLDRREPWARSCLALLLARLPEARCVDVLRGLFAGRKMGAGHPFGWGAGLDSQATVQRFLPSLTIANSTCALGMQIPNKVHKLGGNSNPSASTTNEAENIQPP
jgi:hypothetical protein